VKKEILASLTSNCLY